MSCYLLDREEVLGVPVLQLIPMNFVWHAYGASNLGPQLSQKQVSVIYIILNTKPLISNVHYFKLNLTQNQLSVMYIILN